MAAKSAVNPIYYYNFFFFINFLFWEDTFAAVDDQLFTILWGL